MPELPEVEIVKRSLFKMINKAKIIDVKIYNRNLRYKIPLTFRQSLIDEKFLKISRRSKYLIFYFRKKILLVHLGMSGKLLIMRESDNKIFKTSFYYDLNLIHKHNHIYFKLNNNLVLVYNDVRRFGFFKLYNTTKTDKIKFLKKLGLEPFSKKFNVKYFKEFTQKRKKNIKNLLMDQSFISGLGNIYVNEVLFMARIRPIRSCNDLSQHEIKKLISSTKKILKFSISKGGSSLKDFKNALGKSGVFQQFFYVYGRQNKNCSRISCKGKIKKILIANRSSFYCNKCQS
ncbi:MAG: bifunctional DNA-formamidopyrimidine glycosylase/DNA-(apurinic or apyrimidinic site) lyase [Candidatus Pelagibacterales bacterium]|nr:MAG: bifunctional DNA-formamidopyrimidine glycosylase/DNA-(apurinic or apyrimidinic site) lyase [Pelagibacterales bacterium]